MNINSILFDFDGTLADTAPGIVSTLRESLVRMDKPVPSEEEMVNTIGLPLSTAFSLLGNMSEEEAEEGVRIYQDIFREFEIPKVRIFEEVAETLEALSGQGIRMAVVTSRDSRSLNMIMQKQGIDHFFETQVTFNDHLPSKPAPDMVLALLERMEIQPEETLVVGDTTFDIEMGNRAGCHTCAVTYGNHSLDALKAVSPTGIVDRFGDLWHYVSQK